MHMLILNHTTDIIHDLTTKNIETCSTAEHVNQQHTESKMHEILLANNFITNFICIRTLCLASSITKS